MEKKRRIKIYGFVVPTIPLPLFYSLSAANVNPDSFLLFLVDYQLFGKAYCGNAMQPGHNVREPYAAPNFMRRS